MTISSSVLLYRKAVSTSTIFVLRPNTINTKVGIQNDTSWITGKTFYEKSIPRFWLYPYATKQVWKILALLILKTHVELKHDLPFYFDFAPDLLLVYFYKFLSNCLFSLHTVFWIRVVSSFLKSTWFNKFHESTQCHYAWFWHT